MGTRVRVKKQETNLGHGLVENSTDTFITIREEEKKVLKPTFKAPKSGKERDENILKNEEEIKEIIKNFKIVVRKNHLSKRAYSIYMLDFELYGKLSKELFVYLDIYMFNKYGSRYNRGYNGWIEKEVTYTHEDMSEAHMREMQEAFLKKNKVERVCLEEHNTLCKELKIYKSKSYVNERLDYDETLAGIVHIYNGLRFMLKDGSIDILFTFNRIIAESKGKAYQTFYRVTQTDNHNFKVKYSNINEIFIPNFLEENGFVKFDYNVAQAFYHKYQNELDSKDKLLAEARKQRARNRNKDISEEPDTNEELRESPDMDEYTKFINVENWDDGDWNNWNEFTNL